MTVANTTGNPAELVGFIDFNGNGAFEAGETVRVAVPGNSGTTTQSLVFSVPATPDNSQRLGARFRLSTTAGLGPDGPAPDGEVEDYLIRAGAMDFGDAPDVYGTLLWHQWTQACDRAKQQSAAGRDGRCRTRWPTQRDGHGGWRRRRRRSTPSQISLIRRTGAEHSGELQQPHPG
ncbi:MAG: GEVED domain-containing protein [Candidatus Competibacter sp.]